MPHTPTKQKTQNIPELRFPGFEGEWTSDELGSLVDLRKVKFSPRDNVENKQCIELEGLEKESGKLLRTFNSRDLKSTKNVFYKNDILYGKLRPYLRKFFRATFDGICTTEIWVLNGKKLDNGYLYYFVQGDRFNYYTNQSTGSRMPRADWNFVATVPITYPHSSEQQKIADFLGSVDEWIEYLRAEKDAWEKYKKGMMQKIS